MQLQLGSTGGAVASAQQNAPDSCFKEIRGNVLLFCFDLLLAKEMKRQRVRGFQEAREEELLSRISLG